MDKSLLPKEENAGKLFLSGGIIWIFGIFVSEALYPGYSVGSEYISDLGTGPWPVWLIFNLSTIICGLLILAGALILVGMKPEVTFFYGLAIAGAGLFFVGIFPVNTGFLHSVAAGTALLIGSLAATDSARWLKWPFGIFSAIMGIIGLAALILLETDRYGALGPGGMERMIAYPLVLWIICYGAFLLNNPVKGDHDE